MVILDGTERGTRDRLIRSASLFILSVFIGIYETFSFHNFDLRVALLLTIVPIIIGIFFLRQADWAFIAMLIVSLAFRSRFRFGEDIFHAGGAEASIAPIDFPLLGLFLIAVLMFLTKSPSRTLYFRKMYYYLILFVLVHAASMLRSVDVNQSILEILRLIKMGLLVFIIQFFVNTKSKIYLVINLLMGIVLIQGLLAIVQSVFQTNLGLGIIGERDTFWIISRAGFSFGRAGGTMGHPNALAYFFEALLPISLGVILSDIRGWMRGLAAASLGAGFLGLVLTFSRAGWGSIMIGFSLVIFLVFTFHRRKRLKISGIIFLGLIFLAMVVFVFRENIISRLNLYGETSWMLRLESYQFAWEMIRENWLLGIGANNYIAKSILLSNEAVPVLNVVHNYYLLLFVEIGVFGLLIFVMMIWRITKLTIKFVRHDNSPLSILAISLLSGIAAVMAHSMFDWLFRYDPVHTLFWFVVGLLIAILGVGKRQAHLLVSDQK